MANYENHGLKETKSMFQIRGIVNGTEGNKFFREGFGKNNNGVSVNFGVEFASGKTAYITLSGFPRKTVNYYKKGENGAKGTNVQVPWDQRKQSPGKGYNLIGTRLSTGKDEDGKNINETMIEYDAVNWLHENLHDGDSVFIKGHMEWSSFTKNGETLRVQNLIPEQISYTREPIDFEADNFEEMCAFENTLVFSSIDKELDSYGKGTGRFTLDGYYIDYRSVERTSFVIDENHADLANKLKKNLKPGYAILTYGTINVKNGTVEVEESDGWGDTSPLEVATGPVIREYMVYGAKPSTIDKETWTEEGIAAAIRKQKAAAKATENFGDSAMEDNSIEDWGDADDDLEVPWE